MLLPDAHVILLLKHSISVHLFPQVYIKKQNYTVYDCAIWFYFNIIIIWDYLT